MEAGPDAADRLRELDELSAKIPQAIDAATREWMASIRDLLEIASKPSPWDMIWGAFWRLNDERPYVVQGFGQPLGATIITSSPRPIPWSAVQRWCEVYGLDLDLTERCILAMDAIYLKDWASRNVPRGTGNPGVR